MQIGLHQDLTIKLFKCKKQTHCCGLQIPTRTSPCPSPSALSVCSHYSSHMGLPVLPTPPLHTPHMLECSLPISPLHFSGSAPPPSFSLSFSSSEKSSFLSLSPKHLPTPYSQILFPSEDPSLLGLSLASFILQHELLRGGQELLFCLEPRSVRNIVSAQ